MGFFSTFALELINGVPSDAKISEVERATLNLRSEEEMNDTEEKSV
ncbi:hypothetical protein [Prochlorococcus sp. MIT 1307]|nr:hypothetical protein [Prochlorococcus sp. MIT 1307]